MVPVPCPSPPPTRFRSEKRPQHRRDNEGEGNHEGRYPSCVTSAGAHVVIPAMSNRGNHSPLLGVSETGTLHTWKSLVFAMIAPREYYKTKATFRYAAECRRMARLARGVKQAYGKNPIIAPTMKAKAIRKPLSKKPLH